MNTKEDLITAVHYVVMESSRMIEKIIGKKLPISSLTVFAHSEEEYSALTKILSTIGSPYNENNGPRVVLHEPITVNGDRITHLRIRKPDPERPQRGCNDIDTDYESFKVRYLSLHCDCMELIIRPTYEMIEISDPAFDVLAYVVSR